MDKSIATSDKRGCDRNSLNIILVRADVNSISRVFREYFNLEVYSRSNLKQYIKLKKEAYREQNRLQSIIRKAPVKKRKQIAIKQREIIIYYPLAVWQYIDSDWTTILISGWYDDIAFAFSTILDTDAIAFWESDSVCFSQLKLFRENSLIEHYDFGLECGKLFDNNYWDLIVECENNLFSFPETDEHKFCSSIREITVEEIKLAVDKNRDLFRDSGFLDVCLKYYDAYLPITEETPSNYYSIEDDLVFQQWDNSVKQLDIVMYSNYWSYYDLNVPQQVMK